MPLILVEKYFHPKEHDFYRNIRFTIIEKIEKICIGQYCQTKYTVRHILVEYTDLTHVRETFYSANDMKIRKRKKRKEK